MIDDEKLKKVAENLEISDDDTAFVGAMPNGACTLVSIATEPRVMGTSNWYPVTFKAADGEHEVSLKGMLQAEGLEYSTRNLRERIKIWYSLLDKGPTTAARKFKYTGKQKREITYRKDFTDFNGVFHAKNTKGEMSAHTFEKKMVG